VKLKRPVSSVSLSTTINSWLWTKLALFTISLYTSADPGFRSFDSMRVIVPSMRSAS
jgi:hypothetical protein